MAASALLALGAVGVASASVRRDKPTTDCRTARGSWTAPAALNTTATRSGTLRGTAQLFSSLGQVSNGFGATASYGVGRQVLTLADGDELTIETLSFFSQVPGSVAGLYNISGGAGAYQGATGQLTAKGTVVGPGLGNNTVDYEGTVCTP